MNDTDDLLRRDAEIWNARWRPRADFDSALSAAVNRASDRSHTSLAVRLSAAAVTAATVALVAIFAVGHRSHGQEASHHVAGALVTSKMGTLLVRHPASWHYVGVSQTPMAMASPFGWLSNVPSAGQCKSVSNGSVCVPPLRSLPPGGVYVAAGEIASSSAPEITHPTARVDGHIAQVTASGPRQLEICPTGTTDQLTLIISVSLRPATQLDGVWYVTACTSHPVSVTTMRIRQMLSTVRLSARS